jgi:hypothetical protein
MENCQESELWSGKPAYARRSSDGRLVTRVKGQSLCGDFQFRGCDADNTAGRNHGLHACSGCASSSHGARDCDLREGK